MTPEQFLDFHDIDLRYIEGPRYTGPPLAENTDIWGVLRKRATVVTSYGFEEYSEVDSAPLAPFTSADEIYAYTRWPDADEYDYTVVKEQAKELQEGENALEIKVVNSWYNRVAGDQMHPDREAYTSTNIDLKHDFRGRPVDEISLETSGLLGPVSIQMLVDHGE